jgi:hypothetical protein
MAARIPIVTLFWKVEEKFMMTERKATVSESGSRAFPYPHTSWECFSEILCSPRSRLVPAPRSFWRLSKGPGF